MLLPKSFFCVKHIVLYLWYKKKFMQQKYKYTTYNKYILLKLYCQLNVMCEHKCM